MTFEQIPACGKEVKACTLPNWLTELFLVSVARLNFGGEMIRVYPALLSSN